MSEQARKYFNTYPCPNKPRYLQIGPYLFSFNWANENWTWITDRDTEKTNWLHIGKVRNMQGQTMYELVMWRFLMLWGR